MKNANYYQSKFQAGLLYVGRTSEGEQWLGSKSQFAHAEKLESGDTLEVEHETYPEDAPEPEADTLPEDPE